jgi:trimeric autotransporter adhesin
MSTKTTFKRIALVAVASLGFGVLTSVAPANAAEADVTAVTIAAPGTGRVGSAFTTSLSITTAILVNPSVTLRARFDARPTGSTATVAFTDTGLALKNSGGDISGETGTFTAANGTGNVLLPARYVVADANETTTATSQVVGRVGFIPDVVGNYDVTVWHDDNADGLVGSGESKATATFTVGATPTSVKVVAVSGESIVDGNALVKLTLVDAAGAVAGLAANESITLTSSNATTDWTRVNGSTAGALSDTAARTLVASDFIQGDAWINFNSDTAAGSLDTITITGTGGDVASISGTFTQRFRPVVAPSAGASVMTTGGTTAATYGVASNNGVAGNLGATTAPIGTKSFTYLASSTHTAAATTAYISATVTDTAGFVTGSIVDGISGLSYVRALLLTESATTAGSYTTSIAVGYTGTSTATGQFSVVIEDGLNPTVAAVSTAAISINTLASAITVSPDTALAMKIGGTVSYTATVVDQFGRALPSATVAMSGGTRNAIAANTPVTAVTNSLGQATFSRVDAPAAGVTSLADTFSFKASWNGGESAAVSAGLITWSATGPVVSKVTILGGNNATTTGVADATASVKDIAAGNGAQAGVSTFTATVTDAAGNLLAGVPVTFTVSGTTAAVLSTTQTVYTSALGVASASVYAWVAGNYTVTATAGGIAGTAVLTAAQTTAAEARAISATVSGTLVTAKVVDRFGNNVPGVTVYATKTGAGYFGTGVTSTSAVTNTAGIAEFVIAGGDAEVTVSTLDPNAAAGTLAFGQTCAAADRISCATTATALTAYTAGTALVAEVGVGASLAAAGVSSAKVTVTGDSSAQAAADAAAEATDAANAATDAANAAAEAADAATAAAQDAADAVAALATSVEAMVNALKRQITSLTNLVIKIQKKVRA